MLEVLSILIFGVWFLIGTMLSFLSVSIPVLVKHHFKIGWLLLLIFLACKSAPMCCIGKLKVFAPCWQRSILKPYCSISSTQYLALLLSYYIYIGVIL